MSGSNPLPGIPERAYMLALNASVHMRTRISIPPSRNERVSQKPASWKRLVRLCSSVKSSLFIVFFVVVFIGLIIDSSV